MGDGDRVIALALGFERVADESARDAEFGDRVGRRRRWRSRVEGAGELGVENRLQVRFDLVDVGRMLHAVGRALEPDFVLRSEEHTSELQSQSNLVCRLLLEKKKKRRRLKT